MKQDEIRNIIRAQRIFFEKGGTRDIQKRKILLKNLRKALLENRARIAEAIEKDLGKSDFESYMCETGLVVSEISHMVRHMEKYAKAKRVRTPLAQFAAKSFVLPAPYGTVLVMSPWNYPLLLSFGPLVDAVAAGNTVVLKPSAYAPHTGEVIASIVKAVFPSEYVSVILGGREENMHLLEEKFDYIFFTGSKTVGKLVLEKAAPYLTPVTLELGGKSPCIVDKSANLRLAAKRIVFGKFLNCGQTCVAPDYLLCHESVHDALLGCIKEEIRTQYGTDYLQNKTYGKIISEKHFDRICGLIAPEKVVAGGESCRARLQIAPTVLDGVTFSDPVMQEEIFGPLLPILTFSDMEAVIGHINENEKPLALYIFAEDKDVIRGVTTRCAFGGGCINDTIIHLATSHMGFGGVGESGMGAYHGKTGFDTFSHHKSMVDKKTFMDLPMRYSPYKKFYGRLIELFLR